MQRVGFEGLTVVLRGDLAESARAPNIDNHRYQHYGESPNRGLNIDSAKEEANNCFVNHPSASEQQQTGFDKGGKIFDFAVAVLVVGVGGLVGDSDGKICQQRGDQIEGGVGGFGEDSEAAGGDSDDDFAGGDEERGDDRISGDRALLGAHGVGRIEGRGPGHYGIIAGNRELRQLSTRCPGFSSGRFGSLPGHAAHRLFSHFVRHFRSVNCSRKIKLGARFHLLGRGAES